MSDPAVPAEVQDFVEFCVPLTGFTAFDLYATDMAGTYLDTARRQVGPEHFEEFRTAWKQAAADGGSPQDLSPTHREVARALVYLWYTGAWPRLAPAAHAALRREVANTEFVVAPEAYVEGLVWRTFHGHPAGAKPPGFGTWSVRPPAPPGLPELRAALGLRTGPDAGAAAEDVPAHLLPGFRAGRHVAPSEVPAATAPGTGEEARP
ncbi:hypothetical protein [Streptomyces sp. NPDC049555]|uniref:hypothetical protein n=1 Tax=unclassified Streptomyces TaxID=2593676 RepID=UPI003446AFD8